MTSDIAPMGAPDNAGGLDELAATFRRYVGHYGTASPLYARLAAGIADDPELLALAATARHTPVPNVFLAAVQDLLLQEPSDPLAAYYPELAAGRSPVGDPLPLFRAFCLARRETLGELLATRICQTNEVRRCGLLLPAFGLVAAQASGRPLALLEVGASAGFNLLWDRYAYAYSDGRVLGDPHSGLTIAVALRGEGRPPLPAAMPAIAHRQGVDLSPIDVRDEHAARWLRALIWPGQTERVARLAEAVAIARAHPVPIARGDALELLPDLVAAAPDEAALVVYHSFTFNQLGESQRQAFHALLCEASRTRPIWRIALEWFQGEHPELSLSTYREGHAEEALLATAGGHGDWLAWQA